MTDNIVALPNAAKTIHSALLQARQEMRHAPLSKVNPHFKSKYADLPTVIDTLLPALSKYEISVTQRTEVILSVTPPALMLVTVLHHIPSNTSISSSYPLPYMPDKPQVMGGAMTYARRYALASLLCIASEEDDDGEAVQQATAKNDMATALLREIASCADAKKLEAWWKLGTTSASRLRLGEADQDKVRDAYTVRLQELSK